MSTVDLTGIRAVILDLDGTLMDHVAAARAAAVTWLRSLGGQGSEDDLAACWFAAEHRQFLRFERGEITHLDQRRERLREVLPALDLPLPGTDGELDEAYAGFLEHYRAGWRGYPDTVPCLERLDRAGLRTAVLTNGLGAQQRAKVTACGVDALLTDGVFASADLGVNKPAPGAYEAVCTALDVPVGALLMVGDNPVNDVAGALAAGWHAVYLDREGTGDLPTDHPGAPAPRITTLDALG